MATQPHGSLFGYDPNPELVHASLRKAAQDYAIPSTTNGQALDFLETPDEHNTYRNLVIHKEMKTCCGGFTHSDGPLGRMTTGGSSRFFNHKVSFLGWKIYNQWLKTREDSAARLTASEQRWMFRRALAQPLSRYATEVSTSNDHESVANLIAAVQGQLFLHTLKTLVSKGHDKLSDIDIADVQELAHSHAFEVLKCQSRERCAMRQTPSDLVWRNMISLAEIIRTIEFQLKQDLGGLPNCFNHNPMVDTKALTTSLIHSSLPLHLTAGHHEQQVLLVPARATPKTCE